MNLRSLCVEVVVENFLDFLSEFEHIPNNLIFEILEKCTAEEIFEFEEKINLNSKYEKILNEFYKKEYLKNWKMNIYEECNWKQLYFEKSFLEKFSNFFEFNKFEELKESIKKFGKYIKRISISQQIVSKNFDFKVKQFFFFSHFLGDDFII